MKHKWMAVCALVTAITACSPALNWRTVLMEEAGLQALLPCKPDRASRNVEIAGRTVALHMLGCDADGATFAVSHLAWPDPASAPQALAQWQAAVLARMGADGSVSAPWGVTGSLPLAGSVRMQAQGSTPGAGAEAGKPVVADAIWVARAQGAEIRLIHAVVYQRGKPRAEVADTFLNGMALR